MCPVRSVTYVSGRSRLFTKLEGCRQALRAFAAVFGQTAAGQIRKQVAPHFVPPFPIGNAQKSLSQERDRWFESGSLQR
jgi:hypothetical protein